MTIRVVLADDQALIRSGFRVLIDSADDLEVVGEAGTGDDAVRTVAGGDALLSPKATQALLSEFATTAATPSIPSGTLDALTARERELMTLAAHGLSNDQIAERLFLSPLTVKTHINRAMMKLAVRDRAQLVVLAYQTGLVRPSDSID